MFDQTTMRFGGTSWLRYSVRLFAAVGVICAGFLPYSFDVCGHCRIIPRSEFAARSQLSDVIAKVHVEDGDSVEPGTIIASLVGREVGADLAKAQADVDEASAYLKQMKNGTRPEDIAIAAADVDRIVAELVFAEFQVEHQNNLRVKSAVAESAYERSHSHRESLKIQLTGAKENLSKLQKGNRQEVIDEAQARLAKAEAELQLQNQKILLKEIRSPIYGTVSKPSIEAIAGQSVVPGDLIAVVQDRQQLFVEIMADESAAVYVKKGMNVHMRLWGNYGGLLTGKVQRIVARAYDESKFAPESFRTDRESAAAQQRYPDDHWRYIKVIVSLDADSATFQAMPGMTGEARIAIADDCLWGTLWRDLSRLIFVEVWSWLP